MSYHGDFVLCYLRFLEPAYGVDLLRAGQVPRDWDCAGGLVGMQLSVTHKEGYCSYHPPGSQEGEPQGQVGGCPKQCQGIASGSFAWETLADTGQRICSLLMFPKCVFVGTKKGSSLGE